MKADDLLFLEGLLERRCGLGLRGDKGYFADSRLAPLARREGLASVAELVAHLRDGADDRVEAAATEALAVTDTAFFRDGAAFETLGRVLDALGAARGPDQPVRVWSAGCSTGQEAYSLLMLAEQRAPAVRLELVATDLCERVLEKAHTGLYTQFEVQRGLPIRLLLKHFDKAGEMWAVSPRLRSAVRWRRLNLVGERRSLRRFDLISCRHVASYLSPEVRERVLVQLAASLEPGGVLALGPQEEPPPEMEDLGAGVFQAVAGRSRAAA